MTREEQIQKAASMHESACLWSDNSTSNKESFIRGAKWSDEHPFEEVILTDRRFILDKVCEWLEDNIYDYLYINRNFNEADYKHELIEDLRKAIDK